MKALLVDAVVREGDVHTCDPNFAVRRQRAARDWGEGVALKIRIEPEEDAIRYSDLKHLYGHLYTPVSQHTGETVAEVHLRMKVLYLPEDGRTSITELNREELKQFMESVEQDIREHTPEAWADCCAAMALFDRRSA